MEQDLKMRLKLVAERGPTENKTLHSSRFSVTSCAQAGLLHYKILGVSCVQFRFNQIVHTKLLEFCNVTDQLVRSLLQKTWSAEFCFQLDRAQLQVLRRSSVRTQNISSPRREKSKYVKEPFAFCTT